MRYQRPPRSYISFKCLGPVTSLHGSYTTVTADSAVTTIHARFSPRLLWRDASVLYANEINSSLSLYFQCFTNKCLAGLQDMDYTKIKRFVVFKKKREKTCRALKLWWNVGQMRSCRRRSESYAIWLCDDKSVEKIQTSCSILPKRSSTAVSSSTALQT